MNTPHIVGTGILALSLVVLVGCEGEGTGSEPLNLSITGTDYGRAVLLAWEEPIEGVPHDYLIYFRELSEPDFQLEATVDGDSLQYIHNPSDRTGDYYVAARFGGIEYNSDTMTSIPVHTDILTLFELNAGGNQGYGWAVAEDFMGSTYSMIESANAATVDFYITNFTDDSLNGPWSIPWSTASPDTAPNDPGGGFVPQAEWRTTWFSDPLLDPQEILPNFAPTTYFKSTSNIQNDTTYIGIYLDTEGHYALAKFFGADTLAGTINVESWFQAVQGLRLITH
jgi:hypothetical protein